MREKHLFRKERESEGSRGLRRHSGKNTRIRLSELTQKKTAAKEVPPERKALVTCFGKRGEEIPQTGKKGRHKNGIRERREDRILSDSRKNI